MSTAKRWFLAILLIVTFSAIVGQVAETPDQLSTFIVFAVLIFPYLLPWIIAINREHHNAAAIGVLNLLLGWTAIGWVVALVWACTAKRHEERLPRSAEFRGPNT